MRKNPWLRFFFSYLYVFLFIILTLFLIFLWMIGSSAKQEAINANRVYAQNVLRTFDDYLTNINQTVIREILTNAKMQMYFQTRSNDTLANYELNSKLKDLVSTLPGVDSIYLYRTSDHKVLSDSFMVPLDDFEDRAFLEQRMAAPQQEAWSSSRPYYSFKGNPSQQVVTLTKDIALGNANQGRIVVNVLTYSLQNIFHDMTKSDLHFAFFTDPELQTILSSDAAVRREPSESSFRYISDTTHWTLNTGVKSRTIDQFLSLFSYSWLLFAGLVVLFGIAMLFYVFYRNYKPIDAISNRIRLFIKKNKLPLENDPFAFIESSIEKLITQSEQYEKQAAEDQTVKRNYLFRELILGTLRIEQPEWERELQTLGIKEGHHAYLVLLIEIDEYDSFEQLYHQRDRSLLKFALRSAVQEMSDPYAATIWNDWFRHNRLCHLIQLEDIKKLLQMCEHLRAWAEQYLKFTVTIGIGDTVDHFASIPYSYETAFELLEMKAAVGHNRIISQETVTPNANALLYDSLESIRRMIRQFMSLNDQWEDVFHDVFRVLKGIGLPRKAIASLSDYMVYRFNGEIKELPDELQLVWSEKLLPSLLQTIKQFDTIDVLEQQFLSVLKLMASHIRQKRESSPHYPNIEAIKHYIENHYTDPNLSLNQVSDHFQLSPPYLSAVFKELQGEKFIDFLTRLRMDNAKSLLSKTETSIQDVALAVGYVHSFSFIRVFKKLEGLTPGEYRKVIAHK